MGKILVALLISILLIPSLAQAATIKGTVYDLSLQKAEDVILEIDTIPNQQMVSKTGEYRFTVGNGQYTIMAKKLQAGRTTANSSEKITVDEDGEFNLDIILLPVLDDLGINSDTLTVQLEDKADYTFAIIGIFLMLIVLFAIFYIKKNKVPGKAQIGPKETEPEKQVGLKKETQVPDDLGKMLEIIKRDGGRVNQTDLRKELNLSEAKISLMITDLENRELVKRIKKGRGNIVVLNQYS